MTVLGSVYELPETFFQGLSCPAETAQAVGLTASATSTTDDDRLDTGPGAMQAVSSCCSDHCLQRDCDTERVDDVYLM